MAPYVKPRDMNSSRQLQGLMLCRAALCLGPWRGLVFGTLFCCIFYGLEEVLTTFIMQSLHNGSLQWGWELVAMKTRAISLFAWAYGTGCSPPRNSFQVEVKDLLLGSEVPKVMRFRVELWVLARWHMVLVWFLLSEWERAHVLSHWHRALGVWDHEQCSAVPDLGIQRQPLADTSSRYSVVKEVTLSLVGWFDIWGQLVFFALSHCWLLHFRQTENILVIPTNYKNWLLYQLWYQIPSCCFFLAVYFCFPAYIHFPLVYYNSISLSWLNLCFLKACSKSSHGSHWIGGTNQGQPPSRL